jgi:hypothetical protein
MLGDNRDNSADSRYIGMVPRALLIGRAERVLASADIQATGCPYRTLRHELVRQPLRLKSAARRRHLAMLLFVASF